MDDNTKEFVPRLVCEICWLSEHTHWEPESMNDNGIILLRLIGVDTPISTIPGEVEVCTKCGKITISGIVDMVAPSDEK